MVEAVAASHIRRMPHDDAETLRRRIRLYREYLSAGAEAEVMVEYLNRLASDEAALAEIDGQTGSSMKRSPSTR